MRKRAGIKRTGVKPKSKRVRPDRASLEAELGRLRRELARSIRPGVRMLQQAQLELEQARQDYAGLFDFAPMGLVTLNRHGCIQALNLAAAELLGQDRRRLVGQPLLPLVAKGDRRQFLRHLSRLCRGQKQVTSELSVIVKDRPAVPLQVISDCSRADDPGGGLFHTALVDLGERKRADQALRESQQDLNHAQAVTHIGNWRVDFWAEQWRWSEETYRILGVPQGTPLSYRTFLDTVHPEDRQRVNQKWKAALHGEPYDLEHRIVVDDEVKWVRQRAVLEFDAQGEPLGGLGTVQDITEWKRAEAALAQARADLERKVQERTAELRQTMALVQAERQRFHSVLDRLPAYLVLLSPDYRVAFANRYFEERFGKANGRRCYEYLFQRCEPCEHCEAYQVFKTQTLHQWEWVGPNGRTYEVYDSPFIDADGSSLVLEVGLDITERRVVEQERQSLREELERVSRITTAGQLAASLAHQLNQPVGAIACNVDSVQQLLAQAAPNQAEVREALKDIAADSQRAGAVIHQLRRLYQKTGQARVALQLNDLVLKTVDLLHSELVMKGVSARLDLAAEAPPVLGNEVELQQALLNLITNALEAMAECEANARELVIRTACEGAKSICTSIRDSGTGVGAEQLPRIFAPFYTTKPNGMGMGLAISRSIVEAHGGRLWAENNPKGGMTFHFTLPVFSGNPS